MTERRKFTGPERREASAATSIELLKRNLFGAQPFQDTSLLTDFFISKGYAPSAIEYLAQTHRLGGLVNDLILRHNDRKSARLIDSEFGTFGNFRQQYSVGSYIGSPEQTLEIDKSIKDSNRKVDRRRQLTGYGASRYLSVESRIPQFLSLIPIAIIGAGPGGIITARVLNDLGFQNVSVFDKNGRYGGIWNQENVGGEYATKNNPFELKMGKFLKLKPAPGPGSDISDLLHRMEGGTIMRLLGKSLPLVRREKITGVEPGDLHHVVNFDGGGSQRFPIVVNAIGLGKPRPLSRPGYMETNATHKDAGTRWQHILTPEVAERYRNKTVIINGLGNSGAEMLTQIYALNKRGYNIDFRLITHYPQEAVENPKQTIYKHGRSYRIFRDITEPNLIRWEGDLPEAEQAYYDALYKGKIITDVNFWHIDKSGGRTTYVATKRNGIQERIPYDKLFTLIGYQQNTDLLKNMGMIVTDEDSGSIAYDFDGEVQRSLGVHGRERTYPGYFAIGSLLQSTTNPNAQTIPGIMFRESDLAAGVAFRAAEVFNSYSYN